MKRFLLFVCIVVLCVAGTAQDIVQTKNGLVRGTATPQYRSFLGIPFGASTAGANRWKSPKPADSWAPNVFSATAFGPSCPQKCVLPSGLCPDTIDENCLNLNVYTPGNARNDSKLPVMVFIPGGHFDQGTANCAIYDGRFLVERGNLILVTVNYRLGLLGFLAHQPSGLTGNYGIHDQRLALQWIQENIASFGGDPTQVTLMGESAGAVSVTAHIQSPKSKGLFSRAISQSNPLSLPYRTLHSATKLGDKVFHVSSCSTVDCLQAKSVQEIIDIQGHSDTEFLILEPIVTFFPWTITIDEDEFKEQPINAFRRGEYTEMPMIQGSLSQEAVMFVYLALNSTLTKIEYNAAVAGLFQSHYFTVINHYPSKHDDKRVELSILGTDYIFTAPTRNATINNAIHGQGTYLYLYDHALSFDGWGPRYYFCTDKSCHGAELVFIFNTAGIRGFNMTEEEQVLTRTMQDYWINFAWSADPNVGPRPVEQQWPKVDTAKLNAIQNMQFTTPKSFVNTNYRSEYCDMWDSLGYNFGY